MIEGINKMLEKTPYEQKVLIINKKIYEKHKEEIDNLIENIWALDLVITNTLEENTSAIVMDKLKFYDWRTNWNWRWWIAILGGNYGKIFKYWKKS